MHRAETDLRGVMLGGRYRVGDELGRGAMAVVYAAEDAMLMRDVAVKIVRTEAMDDPSTPARMRREARAVGGLRHPHLITFHDIGEHLSRVYIVMERLRGRSLRSELDLRRQLDVQRGVRIAGQIAGALSAAHGVGVIHRDLKPDNVFLVEGGDDFAKLLDFSVAKVPESLITGRITATGAVFGTPHYIAPEQAIGDSVSPRSDLYSLGVLLFEMIAGRPPFVGKNVIQLLTEQSTRDAPDIRDLVADAPEPLAQLLAALLARSPSARPSTARDVEFMLRALGEQLASRADAPPALPGSAVPRPRPVSTSTPVARPATQLRARATAPAIADAAVRAPGAMVAPQAQTPRPQAARPVAPAGLDEHTMPVDRPSAPAAAAGGRPAPHGPPPRPASGATPVAAVGAAVDRRSPPTRRTQPVSTQTSRKTPMRRTQPAWSRAGDGAPMPPGAAGAAAEAPTGAADPPDDGHSA